MRYDDASQAGSMASDSAPIARPDVDALPAGSYGPESGNAVTGTGTVTGTAGADTLGDGGAIIEVQGAGGAAAGSGGSFQATGQYGVLTIDAQGNYSYVRNGGTPDGVQDVFGYTLADADGSKSSTTLTIDIGQLAAAATPTIPGVINLPPGVQMSDITVNGRDLVIHMPDGSQMVIPGGAVFVPQLVIGDVQVPASNLAALLVESEPQPAAGELQSSGGNFAQDVPPLDPGVPLGDLIPPTEFGFPLPDFEDIGQFIDQEPEAGSASLQLDDDDIPGRNGNAGGTGDDVGSPNATGSGSLPGSGGDGELTWALHASGTLPADGNFSFAISGDALLVQQVQPGSATPVTVLTITVDPDTGAFTVTENNPIIHPNGGDENNAVFAITYSVTDEDGDVALGTLNINVDDDTPTVTVQAGDDSQVTLTTHDHLSIPGDGDSDTAVTSANFGGVFTGTSVSPGADGAGPGTSSTFTLAVTGQNSGLTSHGVTINLFMVGGTVVGTTATSAPANLTDSAIVFTVSTTNTGVVTLTQLLQIDHTNTDPTPTGSPFVDHVISMTDGLVTLTRSETVVDKDQDSITGSATVNIGANLLFTDDGPTMSLGDRGEPQLVVDETNLGGNDTESFALNFSADFGADGPAAAGGGTTYALGINAGPTGLVDTATGQTVVLSLVNGQVVGTAGTGGPTVFVVSVDGSGNVTLDQQRAVIHPDATNPDTDEATGLAADNLITLTATATDFDGDKASQTLNIGFNLTFHDDGPTATGEGNLATLDDGAAGVNIGTVAGLLANDNFGADGQGTPAITIATGSLGGTVAIVDGNLIFTSGHNTAPGGSDVETFTYTIKDGDGDTATATFTVTLTDTGPTIDRAAASIAVDEEGLANGLAGTVYGDGSDLAGQAIHVEGTLAGLTFGVDTPGDITLAESNDTGLRTLSGAVVKSAWDASTHTLTGFVDTNGNGDVDGGETQVFTLRIDNVSTGHYVFDLLQPVKHATANTEDNATFSVGVTVTDSEGDPASGSISILIDDDSPDAVNDGNLASVDDNSVAVNVGNISTLLANDQFGADGVGTPQIAIVGSGSLGGTITIDGSGNLLYTSNHSDAAVETFTYRITDGDGDTDTATFTVTTTDSPPGPGGTVNLQLVEAALDTTQGGSDLAPGIVTGTNDAATTETDVEPPASGLSFAANSDALSGVAFNTTQAGIIVTGLDAGQSLTWSVNGSGQLVGTLHQGATNLGTAIIVALTGDTGSTVAGGTAHVGVTATLVGPLDHTGTSISINGIDVVATQVDADTSHGTVNITVSDDVPDAVNDGNLATLDDNVVAHDLGVASTLLLGNDDFGADGQNTPAITNISAGSLGGTVTIDGSGHLIYTSGHNTAPGGSDVETFTYTIKDGDGDTDTATFTVTLTDTGPTINDAAASISVDEEGLTNGLAGTVYGDGSDLAGQVVHVEGTLAGVTFGVDTPGNITLVESADTGLRTLSGAVVKSDWNAATHTLTGFVDTNGNGNVDGGETQVFTLQIDNVGTAHYIFDLLQPVKHATANTEDNATFNVTATVTDLEGDSDSGTISILIDDDSPDAARSGAAVGTVTLDETRPETQDTSGASLPNGDASNTIDFSANFLTGGAVKFGADGGAASNPVTYALHLSAENIGSGLFALDNTDTVVDSDGYGQGGQILLHTTGANEITGSVGTTDYFRLTIDPATGIVTFTQLNNIWHPTPGSSAAALDETATLTTASASNLQVIQTVTDGDGDTDTASVDIGTGVFAIQDDGPRFGVVDTEVNIANTAPINSTGNDLHFVLGTDTPNGALTGASPTQNPDDLRVDNFTVSVNGTLLDPSDFSLVAGSETATTANYTFSFTYDTGNAGEVTANGTLVFHKDTGTYDVTLDGPIQGFSTLETAKGSAFVGYEFNSATPDNTSPVIAVTTIKDDAATPTPNDGFYLQFTGFSAGNADHETIGDGDPTTWVAGDLLSEGTGNDALHSPGAWVSVSGDSNGVGGDTINGPDALNFNLYSSNPTGLFTDPKGNLPTTSASNMFLVFDGSDSGDDMIVVLKLWQDTDGIAGITAGDTFTTKAIMIEGSDMFFFGGQPDDPTSQEAQSLAALAGTAYEQVSLDISGANGNNNDSLVIIESDDYNTGTESWRIVGAEIVNVNAGVDGTAINLNGDVDKGLQDGSSDRNHDSDFTDAAEQQDFTVADDTAPIKITNIGFLAGASNDQNATLNFDVTIHDADGDTATTSITVNIGDTSSNTTEVSTLSVQSNQVVSQESLDTTSLLSTNDNGFQNQKLFSNGNNAVLMGALAAAGLGASEPLAAQGMTEFSQTSSSLDGELAVHTQAFAPIPLEASVSHFTLAQLLGQVADGSGTAMDMATKGFMPEAAQFRGMLDASTAGHDAPGFAQLAQGTEAPVFGGIGMAAHMTADAIAMPSAEMLVAAGLARGDASAIAGVQHNQVVGQVLVDALHGGSGGPSIDALINAVSGHAGNANGAAIEALASHAAASVPNGDMGIFAGFSGGFGMPMMEHMMMHQDAAPAHA